MVITRGQDCWWRGNVGQRIHIYAEIGGISLRDWHSKVNELCF